MIALLNFFIYIFVLIILIWIISLSLSIYAIRFLNFTNFSIRCYFIGFLKIFVSEGNLIWNLIKTLFLQLLLKQFQWFLKWFLRPWIDFILKWIIHIFLHFARFFQSECIFGITIIHEYINATSTFNLLQNCKLTIFF